MWWVTVKAERSVILHMDKLQSDYCLVSSLNIEDLREKSGNIRRQQTSCRGQERVNVDLMLYILTWVCSLFLVLPFILSFHLPPSSPLHLPRSFWLSCSFSAVCERAALCPWDINTQWPSLLTAESSSAFFYFSDWSLFFTFSIFSLTVSFFALRIKLHIL